jgi:hypothetical protein
MPRGGGGPASGGHPRFHSRAERQEEVVLAMKSFIATACCAAVLAWPVQASAQAGSDWQFGASIYGWFPTIKGSTSFSPPPGSSGGGDLSIDAADILDNLKFVFMGSLEVRNGRWGGFTDIVYMDIGDTREQTRDFLLGRQQVPADVAGKLDYDLKGTVWTLAGQYRTIAEPGLQMDTFVGARMVDIEQTVNLELSGNVGSIALPDRSGSRRASLNNWDAIVGLKGRLSFGEQRAWFVPYYADVGTGESELTFQLMTGIGYAFKWGGVVAQWRYLDYDFGDKVDSLSLNGPAIALNFRW